MWKNESKYFLMSTCLETLVKAVWPLSQRPPERFQDTTATTTTTTKIKIMITDSFKMADVFVGDRTGGAVAQTSAQMIGISMWQGRMWLSRLQGMHGSRWWVVVRAKSAIVDPRDAAVAARGWCSISFLKTNKGSLTTKSPIQNQCHTL